MRYSELNYNDGILFEVLSNGSIHSVCFTDPSARKYRARQYLPIDDIDVLFGQQWYNETVAAVYVLEAEYVEFPPTINKQYQGELGSHSSIIRI